MARELGIRKVTFFPFTNEGTYGTAIPLTWATNFETKNNYKEKEYKADMKIEKSTKILESADVKLEVSSNLPPEVEAKLTGATYVKCVKVTKSTTVPVSGAIAYEIAMDDATVRRRVLFNVALAKDEQKNDVDSEGEVFTFSGKAISDGNDDIEAVMDQKEVEKLNDVAITKLWTDFFTKVVVIPSA